MHPRIGGAGGVRNARNYVLFGQMNIERMCPHVSWDFDAANMQRPASAPGHVNEGLRVVLTLRHSLVEVVFLHLRRISEINNNNNTNNNNNVTCCVIHEVCNSSEFWSCLVPIDGTPVKKASNSFLHLLIQHVSNLKLVDTYIKHFENF
ncbi:hypothetical protein NL676_032549 [Syzygium grande]|nr:hypothetical protein NL676_032549 [Syzygium grande]